MPGRAVGALEQGEQAPREDLVIARAAEPAARAELHEPRAALRAGQVGELADQLADVGDDQVLHDGVERQGRRRIGERHARLAGAGLAQVELAATAVDRLGQVDRRLVIASLARHGVAIRRGVVNVNVPARVRST